jgi:hypothetical protein
MAVRIWKLKLLFELSMVTHACNGALRRLAQEDLEFEASLSSVYYTLPFLWQSYYFLFFNQHIIVMLGVHCDSYKSVCNIPYVNSPPPFFSYISLLPPS